MGERVETAGKFWYRSLVSVSALTCVTSNELQLTHLMYIISILKRSRTQKTKSGGAMVAHIGELVR